MNDKSKPNWQLRALEDHNSGAMRPWNAPPIYDLVREGAEKDERETDRVVSRMTGSGAIGLALIAALIWGGQLLWDSVAAWARPKDFTWLTGWITPTAVALMSAFTAHPWIEAYYKGLFLSLALPWVAYDQTATLLRKAAWFPWSGPIKPLAWLAAVLVLVLMLAALVAVLRKWRWARWALPVLLFAPALVGFVIRFFSPAGLS